MRRNRFPSQDFRASRRGSSLRQSSQRHGSFCGNPFLCEMYRSHKTPQQSSLSKTPDILHRPIVPRFARSRRSSRKKSSLSSYSERSHSQSRSSSDTRCNCKSTNLNFLGWQRHRRSSHANIEAQNVPSRAALQKSPPKHRLSVYRQSHYIHLVDIVLDALDNNPRVRPRICFLLTGLFVTMFGLLFILVPMLQISVPIWLSVTLVCVGAIAILVGAIGTGIYLAKSPCANTNEKMESKTKQKSNRLISIQSNLRKTEEAYNLELTKYKIEGKVWNGRRDTMYCSSLKTNDKNLSPLKEIENDIKLDIVNQKPPGESIFEVLKEEETRSLLSPVILSPDHKTARRGHVQTVSDIKYNKEEARNSKYDNFVINTSFTNCDANFLHAIQPDHFFSSEPNLLDPKRFCEGSESYSEKKNVIHDDSLIETNKKAFEKQCKQNFARPIQVNHHEEQTLDSTQFSILLSEEKRALQKAQEIFDVYHDPLLRRATTRLRFHCECEFRSINDGNVIHMQKHLLC